MHGLQGRTGQFELPAGLQAHIGPDAFRTRLFQADEGLTSVCAVLIDPGPAESLQPGQQRQNALVTVIGNGAAGLFSIAELLVFGPDPEM